MQSALVECIGLVFVRSPLSLLVVQSCDLSMKLSLTASNIWDDSQNFSAVMPLVYNILSK